MKVITLISLVSGLPFVVACASQVDADHEGTALAKLDGIVNNERTQAVADAQVDLVWVTDSPAGDAAVAVSAPITGDFPAAFHLALYTPPEAAAMTEIRPRTPRSERMPPRRRRT